MRKIFYTLLKDLENRVFDEARLKLKVDKSVVEMAVQECDMLYGARPLRRFIEREITTAVARMMLSGEKQMQTGTLVVMQVGEDLVIVKMK